MKYDSALIEIDARQILQQNLLNGVKRREAIRNTRDTLMAYYDITRSDCELICWKTYSNYLTAAVHQGCYIDFSKSSSNLLVIRTPQQKIIFTLFDLLKIAEQSMQINSEIGAGNVADTLH